MVIYVITETGNRKEGRDSSYLDFKGGKLNMGKEKLTFTNAKMFSIVMQNEDFCKGLLERILGKKIEELIIEDKIDVTTEETIIAAIRAKGVRLDVRFTDDETWYSIEMQADVEKYIAQRSSYYHSVIAVNDLKPGMSYGDMKPSYVIFLCCYDPMELGSPVYSFEMYDRENELPLGENRYTILLNSKAEEAPPELKDLFTYMNEGVVPNGDELLERIDEIVREYGAAIMEWEYEYEQQMKAMQKEIDAQKESLAEKDAALAEKDKENAELKEAKAEDEKTIADLKEKLKRFEESHK